METKKMKHFFSVAEHKLCIEFAPSEVNSIRLLPSFPTFTIPECEDLLFSLYVDDTIMPAPGRRKIRKFDTGNGDTIVYRLPDEGYQYIIKDLAGRDCCLLIADKDFHNCKCALNGDYGMRTFGLNNAVMLCYAFASSNHQTLMIHASAVKNAGLGFPFTAKSGTGKSTHTSLWMKYIEGTELMNDDNPIIRVIDGQPYIYGSPWSGKTPCYRQIKAKLGAITRIDRAKENSIEKLGPVEAFTSLLPSCSSMKWDEVIYNNTCDTITKLIETTPIYTLHCRPDEEAARVCHKELVKQ